MNYKNKLAFTFVEMIIAISIVVLLAVVWNGSLSTYKEKSNNSKVISDLSTLNNSLLSYSTENTKLPKAWWNDNFFKSDTSYAHSWTGADTFWAHWFITENTLPNKYLNYLPLDPVTSQYYAYGRTKTDLQFEIAGVILKDSQPVSLVNWNYTAENWPYNLIREYNWPDFVYDKSTSVFPYNPYEKVLTAKIGDFSGSLSSIKINNTSMTADKILSYVLKIWDKIYVATWSTVDLYFSDWTTATLWDISNNSELTLSDMSFNWDTNLFTKVKLALWAWTIWSKATSLWSDSSFEIYTTDSSAAVRWTIFWMTKSSTTNISVLDWNVDVKAVTPNTTGMTLPIIKKIIKWKSIININSTLGNILPNTSAVSSSTLDRFWKLANAIQLNVNYYRKTTSLIDIKLKLNNIIKKKAQYLKLRVWDRDYKLNNNWSHSRELTLTWGTNFTGTWFSEIINGKSKIKLSFCEIKKNWKEKCTKTKTIKLINQKYTKADIWKCPNWKKKFNHECIIEPTWELKGWELFAYAPYDKAWDFNMYTKEWNTIKVSFPSVTSPINTAAFPPGVCISSNLAKSFCETSDWTKGVFLDNKSKDDFIAYSWSELNWKDFMIEMRVRIPQDTATYYLIHAWNFKLFTKYDIAKQKSFLVFSNWTDSTNWQELIPWNFNKIFIEKNNNYILYKVWNWRLDYAMRFSSKLQFLGNINNMYIWTIKIGTSYLWQINNIIDYIKIYKK